MRFYLMSMENGVLTVPGPIALPQLSMDDILLGTIDDARLSANVVLLDASQTLTNKTIDTASNSITVSQSDVTGLTASLALKLDATSYTAADVLTKLLGVDGAGSGLDADFLDGQSSAAFLAASSYTAADVLAKLITVDGAGSGLDADLLDGLSSAAFLQTSSYQSLGPTWTVQHTFTATLGAVVLANTAGPILRLSDTDAATNQKHVRIRVLNGNLSISSEDDALGSVTLLVNTTRSAAAWTNIAFGNATDNTTYSFLGTGATAFGGAVAVTGNVTLGTAGNKLLVKEGTNASMGVATLVLGTVVVNTTVVTATSRIQLTAQSLGTVTVPSALAVSARTAGTSFTILASALTDTSVVAWQIVEPA